VRKKVKANSKMKTVEHVNNSRKAGGGGVNKERKKKRKSSNQKMSKSTSFSEVENDIQRVKEEEEIL